MAGLLLGAPGIARAAFTGTASGPIAASTLTLTAPVGTVVRATCSSLTRTLDIQVTNYGSVPRATSYEFILRDPSGATVETSNGSYFQLLAAKGTWTYQVRGNYTAGSGNVWTGASNYGSLMC